MALASRPGQPGIRWCDHTASEASTNDAAVLNRRIREIWVAGADRYRDPDEDLPADFAADRDAHYAALGLPRDAEAFIALQLPTSFLAESMACWLSSRPSSSVLSRLSAPRWSKLIGSKRRSKP